MRILITGGAGFIGSHVVDAVLAAGHAATVLDDLSSGSRDNLPAGVPLHVADIADPAAVDRIFSAEKPDAVCHQAAQMSVSRSVRDPAYDASGSSTSSTPPSATGRDDSCSPRAAACSTVT